MPPALPIVDSLRVVPITSALDQAVSRDDWNRLAGDVPFCRYEWLSTWWRHYGTSTAHLWLLEVRDAAGALLGLAPLYVAKSPWRGRVVRLLASGEVCSDYLSLLAAPGDRQPVAQCLARWLAGEGAGLWDLIELDGVGPEDSAIDALADELAGRGHQVHVRQAVSAWRIALPDTWTSYVAQLSRTRRERVRQIVRRYFDTGRAVAHTVTHQDQFDEAWRILVDLHQRRHTNLGEPGCFASSRFAAFHAEAARRMLDAGRLRLHWIELDGRPAAAEYGLVGGSTVYYYQAGLDPALLSLRPGWINLIYSIRSAIEQGYRSFDLLRGDEAYKASWRGRPCPLREFRIVGRDVAARVRHRAWLEAARVKQCLAAGWDGLRAPRPAPTHTANHPTVVDRVAAALRLRSAPAAPKTP